jgi:hypothetical protein
MAFKEIVWYELAKMELANILEFYLLRNGNATYSFNILNEVEEIMQTLSQNEMIGRLTSNKFTRTIPMKSYAIFYEINGNKIEIVSFWDRQIRTAVK